MVARSEIGVGVLARAVAILDVVESSPMGASDLARELDLSLSTTYRLATDMVKHGLLRKDQEGRFYLGQRFVTTALSDLAIPALRELSETTGESAQLCGSPGRIPSLRRERRFPARTAGGTASRNVGPATAGVERPRAVRRLGGRPRSREIGLVGVGFGTDTGIRVHQCAGPQARRDRGRRLRVGSRGADGEEPGCVDGPRGRRCRAADREIRPGRLSRSGDVERGDVRRPMLLRQLTVDRGVGGVVGHLVVGQFATHLRGHAGDE